MIRFLAIAAGLLALSCVQASAQSEAERRCDELAGYPYEPGHNGVGVEWGEVKAGPALDACRAALAEKPDAPEIKFRLARTLLQEDDRVQGMALMLAAARTGYAPAMAAYGTEFLDGPPVGTNLEVAAEWLTKAADAGNAVGQYNLALMNHRGMVPAPDFPKAERLYRASASQGYVPAMYGLAYYFDCGCGVAPDGKQALFWYRRAAEHGFEQAYWPVGHAYFAGYGVESDHVEAVKWFRKSADAGSMNGKADLALAYWSGDGVEKDEELGSNWMRQAAEGGLSRAQLYLGQHLMDFGKVVADNEESLGWLEQAGAAGQMEAYTFLGQYYLFQRDYRRAREYANVALNHGNGEVRSEAKALLDNIQRNELRDRAPFKVDPWATDPAPVPAG